MAQVHEESADPLIFMTIPTAGARPHLLSKLVEQSGLPRSSIVLVVTKPGVSVPQGTFVVEDFGPPNIQRWWLTGLQTAEDLGARHVAVVNDDVLIGPDSLLRLSRALDETGAAIASPSRPPFPDGLHRGELVPYEPRLWGALWMLDLSTDLRPDPRYHWWYGDNDLDIRARSEHGGVVLVPVEYSHQHSGEGTSQSPTLQELSEIDARTFEKQYKRLLARSRGVPPRPLMSRIASRFLRP